MNIKDGDYFHYSWKVGEGPSTDPYWCRDRKCVARADSTGIIWLIDTYNYWPFNDKGKEDTNIFTYDGLSREYSKYVNTERFDLEFICNLNDYEYVHEYAKDDYEDVVFVGYQCTKKWAKLKGSEVSNKALLAKYVKEYNDLLSQKEYIESRLLSLSDKIDELEAHQAWARNKIITAKELASQQTDGRIAQALLNKYENMGEQYCD